MTLKRTESPAEAARATGCAVMLGAGVLPPVSKASSAPPSPAATSSEFPKANERIVLSAGSEVMDQLIPSSEISIVPCVPPAATNPNGARWIAPRLSPTPDSRSCQARPSVEVRIVPEAPVAMKPTSSHQLTARRLVVTPLVPVVQATPSEEWRMFPPSPTATKRPAP